MKNFRPKMVEISNFELQKSYIPQKKAENVYKTDSARKNKIFCKKRDFFQFFRFFSTCSRAPKIFDVQFSKNFKKKSKNDSSGTFQFLRGTKSWVLVSLALNARSRYRQTFLPCSQANICYQFSKKSLYTIAVWGTLQTFYFWSISHCCLTVIWPAKNCKNSKNCKTCISYLPRL